MADEGRDDPRRPLSPQSEFGYPMGELRRQMDRLFDDFTSAFGVPGFGFPGWGAGGRGAHAGRPLDVFGQGLMPDAATADVRFDVSESDQDIEITAEVPGISESDIDVQVAEGVLTIKGEKKAEEDRSGRNYYLSERRYGAFSRSFRLPETIDQERISAEFDKGVLKVSLPKKPAAQNQAKKIDVKSR